MAQTNSTKTCVDCGKDVSLRATRCRVCANRHRGRIVPPNPSGLCMCRCGQPAPIAKKTHKGVIKGLPVRFITGHGLRKYRGNAPYIVNAETGCWDWQGGTMKKGHARDGSTTAYRKTYEARYGPIQKGLELHHDCENPRCVNPEHLIPLTPLEHRNRHKDQWSTLTDEMRRLILEAKGTMTSIEAGKRFGYSPSYIRLLWVRDD